MKLRIFAGEKIISLSMSASCMVTPLTFVVSFNVLLSGRSIAGLINSGPIGANLSKALA